LARTSAGKVPVPALKSGPKLLLEGRPGAGKSTVARRLAVLLRDAGLPLAGFITEEIREGGRRLGFSLATLDGARGTLAHVDIAGPPRVGKYGVDLDVVERLAVPALAPPAPGGIVIVDELGKMELASERFRKAVSTLFGRPGAVVATVQTAHHALTDALKRSPDTETFRVTSRNRDDLPRELATRLADGGHSP
jgi:nucleoside-triphosphatase